MQHLGTKILKTKRLVLRPFRKEDAQEMFQNWANDDEVTKFLTWPSHNSMKETEEIVNIWAESYGQDNTYQWAIAFKEHEDKPIGSISVVNQNDQIQKVEIGYCLGRNWWKKGITSEALLRVIEYFFEEVGVNRVEAKHDIENPGSGAVMKKSGMKFEGMLRQAGINNQGICDIAYYSILHSEWGK